MNDGVPVGHCAKSYWFEFVPSRGRVEVIGPLRADPGSVKRQVLDSVSTIAAADDRARAWCDEQRLTYDSDLVPIECRECSGHARAPRGTARLEPVGPALVGPDGQVPVVYVTPETVLTTCDGCGTGLICRTV